MSGNDQYYAIFELAEPVGAGWRHAVDAVVAAVRADMRRPRSPESPWPAVPAAAATANPIGAPVMAQVCQVADPGWRNLNCGHHESGGYACERLDAHSSDGHRFGRHTIEHARLGNGYACKLIEPSVLPTAPTTTTDERLSRIESWLDAEDEGWRHGHR